MSDVIVSIDESIPDDISVRYEDMGDGTHALVIVGEVGQWQTT